jgi:uncharacterized caspase-like protein
MSAGRGTFVAFVTAPGRIASDGSGRNGLFTENLLGALSTPELLLGELFDLCASGSIRAPLTKNAAFVALGNKCQANLVAEIYFTGRWRSNS